MNENEITDAVCAHQLKPWSGITESDYDFRQWVNGLGHCKSAEARHLLWLGIIYEYARESTKLRGLLAIVDPKRKPRQPDEWKYQSFEDLTEAEAASGRANIYVRLRLLAPELAGNKPFADVSAARRKQALDARPGPQTEGAVYFENFGVNEALEIELRSATTLETFLDQYFEVREAAGEKPFYPKALNQSPKPPKDWPVTRREFRKRHFTERGEEIIALRVNWKDCTDDQLAHAFWRFVKSIRPVKNFPEPTRRGKGKSTTLLAQLDDLSAMRLICHYEITEALEKFSKIALILGGEEADKNENNFRTKARRAIENFKESFPWDKPVNGDTYAKRKR